MLSSKRDRFIRSKEDRAPDVTFFRQLQEHWHPTSRIVVFQEHFAVSGRYALGKSTMVTQIPSAKPAWTPWLWVGS